MPYYDSSRKKLEDLIDKFTTSQLTRDYLKILERQGYLPLRSIIRYTKSFSEELRKKIPEDEYYIICSGKKDNRKSVYNPTILIKKLKREIIRINKRPSFSNFVESLDILLEKLNRGRTYVRYPYSVVMIFDGNGTREAYEIPLIRIPEAYFLLIYNKDLPVKKEPPMKGGNFINEFEIEINSNPKKDFTKTYIEGYRDQGNFRIYSDSEADRMQRMRKIKYRGEIYYANVLGRAPLQALYTLNLLENRYNNSGFKVIVPDPSLLKIVAGIYRALLDLNKFILPEIFTYLMIHAEINKRRSDDMNSFFITTNITRDKLDTLHNMLNPSIFSIKSVISRKTKMKSAVS